MSRRERERLILEIVSERKIGTQEELVRALAERGIEVTQTTVSRDIRRLGLVKVPAGGSSGSGGAAGSDGGGRSGGGTGSDGGGRFGGYRYAPPDALDELRSEPTEAAAEELRRAFDDFVRVVERVRDTIVVRTDVGAADVVAVAIDAADVPGVAATLAGDDTIFVLTRTDEDLAAALSALRELPAG